MDLSPTEMATHNMIHHRHARGLTRKALADRVSDFLPEEHGWTRFTVIDIEQGRANRPRRSLTLDELFAVASALDLHPFHLFISQGGRCLACDDFGHRLTLHRTTKTGRRTREFLNDQDFEQRYES